MSRAAGRSSGHGVPTPRCHRAHAHERQFRAGSHQAGHPGLLSSGWNTRKAVRPLIAQCPSCPVWRPEEARPRRIRHRPAKDVARDVAAPVTVPRSGGSPHRCVRCGCPRVPERDAASKIEVACERELGLTHQWESWRKRNLSSRALSKRAWAKAERRRPPV